MVISKYYNLDEIDPLKLYPRSFCCRVIPSSHEGKTLNARTWHRWRGEGKFEAVRVGDRWFMRGAELLRLVQFQRPKGPLPRSKARREREALAAIEEIRKICAPPQRAKPKRRKPKARKR